MMDNTMFRFLITSLKRTFSCEAAGELAGAALNFGFLTDFKMKNAKMMPGTIVK